ncbi:rhamnulokinase family protein [Verrucomicrobiota bacterium]
MNAKRLYAADLGASGGKCFCGLFEDGSFSMEEVHRFAHEGVPFFIADSDGKLSERSYWDDILLYRNIVEGLHVYRREVSDRLDSIGIDTWGADGHFLSADGEMLGKVYCYRDHRLDDMIGVVTSLIDARRVYQITGIHFQPFNLNNQLRWFVSNRRDLLRPGCFYLPVPSLFYYYLGGGRKVDSSWASVTQLMDAKTKQWSAEIMEKLEIPPEVLPEIVEPGTVLGRLLEPLARAVGINQAELIAVGSHDTASAFAAAPVDNTDDALIISSGTWSLVGKLIPEPITSDAAMEANISNEGGIGNTRFLKNCMGTWLAQELRRVWAIADGKEMDWDELTGLARSAPAFATLIDPDDPGFYNPSNMEEAITAFCRKSGQPVPADRGACLRAVYESLALKYRTVNEQICNACERESRVVNVVGGGSKNEMLNQFTADALGMPVMAGPEEATAVGNFMVQAVGLGIIPGIAEAQPIIREAFPLREYRPRDPASWNKAYSRFSALLESA